MANRNNKELHKSFRQNSEAFPNARKIIDAVFSYGKGVSGLPQDPSEPQLYLNLYNNSYEDKPEFTTRVGELYLKYQGQKNDYKHKTYWWCETHEKSKVRVITDAFGGRILKGTLYYYDEENNYLWIKVDRRYSSRVPPPKVNAGKRAKLSR